MVTAPLAMEWSGQRCTANHTLSKMSKKPLTISVQPVQATPRMSRLQLTLLVSSVAPFVIAGLVILSLLTNLRHLGKISHQQKRLLYVNGLFTRVQLDSRSVEKHSYIEFRNFLAGSHPDSGINDSSNGTQICVLENHLVLIPNEPSASIAPLSTNILWSWDRFWMRKRYQLRISITWMRKDVSVVEGGIYVPLNILSRGLGVLITSIEVPIWNWLQSLNVCVRMEQALIPDSSSLERSSTWNGSWMKSSLISGKPQFS
jgi:hypothetical protein